MPIATTAPDANSPAHSSAAVSRSSAGHDPVDDAERERFVGPDLAPAPDDLLGPRRPDQPGQPLGAAAPGEDPEQDLREARPGRSRRAMRRSHASATSSPPPSAYPLIAAITGRGIAGSASMARRNAGPISCDATGSVNSLMSAPAANARSLPVTTTALTVAVAAELLGRVGDRVEQCGTTAGSVADG